MTTISIRERGITTDQPVIAIDGQEYPIIVSDPFSDDEAARLEWYFEEHLAFPFVEQVRAGEAAQSIMAYGEKLFDQIFDDRHAFARYSAALQAGVETLTFEIAGSPAFQTFHWEALKDPERDQPLALHATFVRRTLHPQKVQATVRESPTINLLVVTARPSTAQDVGYRTISRPLVEALRRAELRVQIEILRPATFEALAEHLEGKLDAQGTGYYHVIHFDVHGALLTFEQYEQATEAPQSAPYTFQSPRHGRSNIVSYAGQKGFLLLEGNQPGLADPVEATELAALLTTHQIPVAILNACQSGKQVGAAETSLASHLIQAGMQTVLAMRYSVTVTAAEIVMERLYEQLFAGTELTTAIRRARLALHNQKERKVYFNQTLALEDWLLPVVYQNQAAQLRTRAFTPDEHSAFYEEQARRYVEPAVAYRFVGRDLDVLQIERRLSGHQNVLLIQGMGGAGKTTLLHHLASWWQTTGFVTQVFYFGYDSEAWTRHQIMDSIARQLLTEVDYIARFQTLSSAGSQQAFLADQLRATRHLLILDNLESITGTQLAIQNTLPQAEQQNLHSFVQALSRGKTVVLLGSRGSEGWLKAGTFERNLYELPGLDSQAASSLADEILEQHNATHYRKDADFVRLLKLLQGYPLALEVVLANLARQTPSQVLTALEAGDVNLDNPNAKDKTESILQCIAYSHSNLSPESQQLLLCLAPFVGVIYRNFLPQYTERLQEQPALRQLPFDRWDEVIKDAMNWGLLTPDSDIPNFLRIQPILPYFLQNRVAQQPALQLAIETAFRQHYSQCGQQLNELITAKEPQEKMLGRILAQYEYENLYQALQLALAQGTPLSAIYLPLHRYIESTQDHARGITLGQSILAVLDALPPESLTDDQRFDQGRILTDLGWRQRILQHYDRANTTYKRSIGLIDEFVDIPDQQKATWKATTYHQLGIVAQEQRQWGQANNYHQQALTTFIEFNDHHNQASIHHHLGIVAQEQRQWGQANDYYQQALATFIKLNDRHSQATTYHQLGMVAQRQHQWGQANDYYQQALAIMIEFSNRYNQAGTYYHLGIVAEEQRQWGQANEYYQQALAIFIEFNDHHNQATTYHQLGMFAQKQRQWSQANDYYQKVLAIKIEFNDRYGQAKTYGQLGILAEAQGQRTQACDYLLDALTIFVAFEDERNTGITIGNLARLGHDGDDPTLAAAVAGVVGATAEEVVARFEDALA